MQTEKVYAKTITRKKGAKPVTVESVSDAPPSKALKIADHRAKNPTVSDQVAGDRFYYLNQYFPGGREAFPGNVRMHVTHKYYPYAKGGPLYVDEPQWPFALEECKRKQVFLKSKGIRYVLIQPETTVEQAFEQLGELCPGQQALKTYVPS